MLVKYFQTVHGIVSIVTGCFTECDIVFEYPTFARI